MQETTASNCPNYMVYLAGWTSEVLTRLGKGDSMQRNFVVPRNHHIRKKVRGSKRKLNSFERALDSIVLGMPHESLPHDKSWRYHLPSPHKVVDSVKSSLKLRKKFLQLLADKLVELDNSSKGRYKTLLSITLPLLSQSRIEICVDDKYFEKLIDGTDGHSGWTPMSQGSIIRELNVALPAEYRAKGYSRNPTEVNTKNVEENWIVWKAG